MNIENLEKANKIQKRLEFLKEQKGKFEQSERLWSDTFETKKKDYTNAQISYLSREFVDFNILRTFALQKIKEEIEEKEQEFQNL